MYKKQARKEGTQMRTRMKGRGVEELMGSGAQG
jgi:hypothetical protein